MIAGPLNPDLAGRERSRLGNKQDAVTRGVDSDLDRDLEDLAERLDLDASPPGRRMPHLLDIDARIRGINGGNVPERKTIDKTGRIAGKKITNLLSEHHLIHAIDKKGQGSEQTTHSPVYDSATIIFFILSDAYNKEMKVFSDHEFFLTRLASPYFRSLIQHPSELAYKYPTSSPLHDLSHGLRTLSPHEIERAKKTLDAATVHVFRQYPILRNLRLAINILFLTDPRVEGGSSWTHGTTIILASWESLAHEMVHIFQRAAPAVFESSYLKRGFRPIAYEDYHHLLSRFPDKLIDNPDMCSRYYAIDGWICAYQRGMRPVLIHEETLEFRSASSAHNHPHEMLASWFEANAFSDLASASSLPPPQATDSSYHETSRLRVRHR